MYSSKNLDVFALNKDVTQIIANSKEQKSSYIKTFETFASDTYLQQRIIQESNAKKKLANTERIRKNKLREKPADFDEHFIDKNDDNKFNTEKKINVNNNNQSINIQITSANVEILKYIEKPPENNEILEACGESNQSCYNIDVRHNSEANEIQKSKSRPILICEYCSKTFTWKDSLLAHMAVHTGVYPFQCNLCEKKFALQSRLNLHVETVHMDRSYTCDRCAKSFAKVRHLRRHLKVHEESKSYSCRICSKTFVVLSYLKGHIRIHLRDRPSMYDITIIDSKGIEKPSYSTTLLNSFVVKNFVDDEIKKIVSEPKRPAEKRKPCGNIKYICIECGKCFSRSWEYREHQRKHTQEKEFKCEECGKCFKYQQGMICHKRLHNKDAMFKCQICNKGFYQVSNYKRHLMMHSGDRPHICQKCGKGFVIKPLLIRHSKSCEHRKFVCVYCHKAFTKQKRLEFHMRQHNFKYSCEMCKKLFETDVKLKKHKCKKNQLNFSNTSKQAEIDFKRGKDDARKLHNSYENIEISSNRYLDYPCEHEIKDEIMEGDGYDDDVFCDVDNNMELNPIDVKSNEACMEKCGIVKGIDGSDVKFKSKDLKNNMQNKIIFENCILSLRKHNVEKESNKERYSKNVKINVKTKKSGRTKAKSNSDQSNKITENKESYRKTENAEECSEFENTIRHNVTAEKDIDENIEDVSNSKSTTESYCANFKSKKKCNKKDIFPEGTRYKCDMCESTFVQKWSLIPHLRAHTHPNSFICELCGKGFAYQTNLRDHRRIHLNIRPYKCKICGKAFYQIGNLRSHELNHNRVVEHICEICGKEFVRKAHLRLHILRHEGYRPFVCSLCPKTFGSEKSYLRHMQKSNHENILQKEYNLELIRKEVNNPEENTEGTLCYKGLPLVKKRSNESEALFMDTHECEKQQSSLIDVQTASNFAMTPLTRQHEVEDGRKRRRILNGRFVCEKCNERFLTAEHLRRHSKTHTAKKDRHSDDYDCNNSNVFSKAQCSVCFRFYLDDIRLQKHFKNKHKSDGGIFCLKCNKRFKYKEDYKGHLLLHSGRKVSVCSVCERVFANPSRLKEHQILHNVGSPFKCGICSESYRIKRSLSNHIKKVHPDEKFVT